MNQVVPGLLGLLILCSCGSSDESRTASSPMTEQADSGAGPAESAGTEVHMPLPQIAYTYNFAFRLPSDEVAATQERHLKSCERLGPLRCRVVDMQRSASSGELINGSLSLQIAAPLARAFGDQLVASAADAGADTIDRGITTEELSKQIVDADARIRTKEALVQRLTALLETRSGNIAQAVEAERAINAAQEELERARAWLAEMRGRVAMSRIEVRYESASRLAGCFTEPLRSSLSAIGGLVGRSLALIITLIAVLLPWLVLAALLVLAWRWLRPRLPWLRSDAEPEHDIASSEPLDVTT